MGPARRVLVLVNPKAGLGASFGALEQAVAATWEATGAEVYYQLTHAREDGARKARAAVGLFDTVLVAGGDGTVNTVGRELVGSATALGVIPTGSGNGFARHFGIPLDPALAAAALAAAPVHPVDVGLVNGVPFFVTCGMAWDAAIVRSFERFPVRGVLPYVLAGLTEYLQYVPQPVEVRMDDAAPERFEDPVVLTVANLSQYGGGAVIAPGAQAWDGLLELVVALQRDAAKLLVNVGKLFDGSLAALPEVVCRRFRRMEVRREAAGPIQVDGELVACPASFVVEVRPGALRVLVPLAAGGGEPAGRGAHG